MPLDSHIFLAVYIFHVLTFVEHILLVYHWEKPVDVRVRLFDVDKLDVLSEPFSDGKRLYFAVQLYYSARKTKGLHIPYGKNNGTPFVGKFVFRKSLVGSPFVVYSYTLVIPWTAPVSYTRSPDAPV